MWYIYATEYNLINQKNEIMSFATTWMDLEITILSEVNLTKEYHMMSLICRIFKK